MKKLTGIAKQIGKEQRAIFLVTEDDKTTCAYKPDDVSRKYVTDAMQGKRVEITLKDKPEREFSFIRLTSDQEPGKDTARLVETDAGKPANAIQSEQIKEPAKIEMPDLLPEVEKESTEPPKAEEESKPNQKESDGNYFTKLMKLEGEVSKKGGLNYISWASAWCEVKKVHPDAIFKVYENGDGLPYFADKTGGMVKVGATINNIEHIVWLPIMNHFNKSIVWEKITSTDINKSIQRALTKSLAFHGFGIYVYKGEDTAEEGE